MVHSEQSIMIQGELYKISVHQDYVMNDFPFHFQTHMGWHLKYIKLPIIVFYIGVHKMQSVQKFYFDNKIFLSHTHYDSKILVFHQC